jgi:hypothetical protein
VKRALPAAVAVLVLAALAGAVGGWWVMVHPYLVGPDASADEIAAGWSDIEALAAWPEPGPDGLWRELMEAEEGQGDVALRAWSEGGGGVPAMHCPAIPDPDDPNAGAVAVAANVGSRDSITAFKTVSAALEADPSTAVRVAALRVARAMELRGGLLDTMVGLALTTRVLEAGPVEGIDEFLPRPADVVPMMAREAVCALRMTDGLERLSRTEQIAKHRVGPSGVLDWVSVLRFDLAREFLVYKNEWIVLIGELQRAGDDYAALGRVGQASQDRVPPKSLLLEVLWPSVPSVLVRLTDDATAVLAMAADAEVARGAGSALDEEEAELDRQEAELAREEAELDRQEAEMDREEAELDREEGR